MSKMVGKLLKLLDDRGMSQAELESRAGLSRQRVSNLKDSRKGKSRLTGDEILAIARVLSVSTDYLLDDSLSEPQDAAGGSPELSQEQSIVLRIAREVGYETAIRRLTLAPEVTSPVPSYDETQRKRRLSGRDPKSRRSGA